MESCKVVIYNNNSNTVSSAASKLCEILWLTRLSACYALLCLKDGYLVQSPLAGGSVHVRS